MHQPPENTKTNIVLTTQCNCSLITIFTKPKLAISVVWLGAKSYSQTPPNWSCQRYSVETQGKAERPHNKPQALITIFTYSRG